MEMQLDGKYTIYFEESNGTPNTPNQVLNRMARMTGAHGRVIRSILVVKQSYSYDNAVIDIVKDDMLVINYLLNSILHYNIIPIPVHLVKILVMIFYKKKGEMKVLVTTKLLHHRKNINSRTHLGYDATAVAENQNML
ncbi:hypothetical protein EDB19DRAFT_1832808 [Suillus lakei]|nr:hypothetical protein EDB19DRAFT_1832808 [Suillus lakei]